MSPPRNISLRGRGSRARACRSRLSFPATTRRATSPHALAASLTWGPATEIIFVDDGSTDGTRAAVLAAMEEDPRVRLVAYDSNHGKANAVRAGFDAARNDVLMILDADMTVAPEDLPKFLAPLEAGTADFVNGTRLVYPMEGQAMPTANFRRQQGVLPARQPGPQAARQRHAVRHQGAPSARLRVDAATRT